MFDSIIEKEPNDLLQTIDDIDLYVMHNPYCDLCNSYKTSGFKEYYKDGNEKNKTIGNVMVLCNNCYNQVVNGIPMTVSRKVTIDVAHHLPGHPSCGYLHGHTIDITVGINGKLDLTTMMVIDFGELKKILKEIIVDKFDHRYLNRTFQIPTSEVMSLYIYNCLKERQLNVEYVRVHETRDNFVEMRSLGE